MIADAQVVYSYMMGQCIAFGRGVTRADAQKGVRMIEKAAAGGVVPAMKSMAEAHSEGFGVLQDDDRADYWRRKARGMAA